MNATSGRPENESRSPPEARSPDSTKLGELNQPVWDSGTAVPFGPTLGGDTMTAGQVLLPGQGIRSANNLYQFVYQSDGNLVLYGPAGVM